MEEDLELRFVCKLCEKRYPCGKSLGGHMRSHVTANSAESDEKLEPNVPKESSPLNGGKFSRFELGGHSGYGLRENPRRTWRVSGSNLPSQQEKICKQCGKGFQSLKALCGHMACHSSEKERVLKDDHSWTSENQKLAMDSHSDTESEAPRLQPKRSASSSTRYKRIVIKSSSLVNGSSSVSEIDHEQEEVAICLMMLSRDSGNWVGFNSFADSSDNNSVVLETKSSSSDLRIGRNKGLNCSQNGDEASEIKKLGKGKSKSGDLEEDEHAQFESSDSGYFMNGPKKVDSDVSIDGFLTNDNFKNQKLESRSRFRLSDTELGKGLINKAKCRGTELRNGLSKQKVYDEGGIAKNSNHSRKRIANGSYNPDSYGATYEKMSKGYSIVENAPKRSKHESGRGNKKQTVRALSFNGDGRSKLKKSKAHECPICHRVFKSGQALGGHKRSHFLGGSEQKSNQRVQTLVTKEEEISDVPDLLDLNLPAPPEEEANEHGQFVPW